MTTKIITASLRDNSSGKRTFFINIRPNLVEELNLKDKPHVEVTRSEDKYRIKFLARQTARSRKISFKDSYAYVGFAPELFKLTHPEPVSSFPIDAELNDDGMLEFDFDTEEFIKPRATLAETRKIKCLEDKVAAGFAPDSAWGMKLQMEMDEKIEHEIIATMKRKYAMPADEIIASTKLNLVEDKGEYAQVWVGYATISQKVVK
jgi:hypothetical protein